MTIQVVKFKMEHHEELLRASYAKEQCVFLTKESFATLEKQPYCRSFINKKGKVVACAGAVEMWGGRAEVWMILNHSCVTELLSVHKWLKAFLDNIDIRRLEAVVAYNFMKGHQWVRLLGFDLEGPRLYGYFPDGSDAVLYAKVSGQ